MLGRAFLKLNKFLSSLTFDFEARKLNLWSLEKSRFIHRKAWVMFSQIWVWTISVKINQITSDRVTESKINIRLVSARHQLTEKYVLNHRLKKNFFGSFRRLVVKAKIGVRLFDQKSLEYCTKKLSFFNCWTCIAKMILSPLKTLVSTYSWP